MSAAVDDVIQLGPTIVLAVNHPIGNVIVMAAALGLWGTSTVWPALTVGAVMAGIFLTLSVQILQQAWREYRKDNDKSCAPWNPAMQSPLA